MKKSEIIFSSVMVVAIVVMIINICNTRSNLNYADFDCPRCGSSEVLISSEDHLGNTHYICPDCHTEMYDCHE